METIKGISPLIAAVLLLAFTMAIASLFAQWAPDLMQEVMGDTDEAGSEIQECGQLRAEIISVDHEEAIIQQQDGSEPLGNVSVTWFYNTNDGPEQTWGDLNTSRATKVIDEPLGTMTDGDIDQVEMSPTECEGAPSHTYEVE